MNNLFLLIFLISLISTIVFVVRSILSGKRKDKAEQRSRLKLTGITFVVCIISFIAFGITADPVAETNSNQSGESVTWDDVKEKDNIVGVSDKDFSKLKKMKSGKVRDDVTGKWRMLVMSGNEDVLEYLISYEKRNMKEDEVHFIINFTNQTTTVINNSNGLLGVDVKEYVSKEEHSAKTIGSGMLLKSYIIYPDGDIEEI